MPNTDRRDRIVMDYSPPILAKPTTERVVRGPVGKAPDTSRSTVPDEDDAVEAGGR